ncbi:MAG TPA: M56 family metallopeptidase [Gemmatimonadaceae bacterium]|nr:M56 family metallopeptidase [Gemmatimonadaceae bacterium]
MNALLLQLDARGFAAIALKATLLVTAGWCLAVLLRRKSPVTRHTLWLGVIIGAVIVPALARFGPIEVPVLAIEPAPSVAAVGPIATPRPVAASHDAATRRVTTTQALSGDGQAWSPQDVALTLWLGVALLILARFVAGVVAVRRIAHRARTVDADVWQRALDHAAQRVGVSTRPRIAISAEVDVAFTCNMLTPVIVLPAAAEEWRDDMRHAVLAHELAHIKRRDLLSQTTATIACAMYWFNPLVWGAARRLHAESELASDDMVLASGVRPADYAQHLLNLVTTIRHGAPREALAMARPREFEGRLVAILDRARMRAAPDKFRHRAMFGIVGALTISVGAVVPVPRATSRDNDTVTDPSVAQSFVAPAPMRVTVETGVRRSGLPARLSDAAQVQLLRSGRDAVINPLQLILRYADSLALDGAQADSVAMLNRAYLVALDKLWRPVLRYYATHAVEDEQPTGDPLSGAPLASVDALARFAPLVSGVLTRDQRARLPAGVARWLDPRELSALRSRVATSPDALFQVPARPGARVGQGGVVRRPERGHAG